MAPDSKVKEDSESHTMISTLVKIRSQRRLARIELFHSIFRMTMLWYSLKIPGYEKLNIIFVTFLGNLSAWISLLKFGIKKREKEVTHKKMKLFDSAKLNTNPETLKGEDSKRVLVRALSSVFLASDDSNKEQSKVGSLEDLDNNFTVSQSLSNELHRRRSTLKFGFGMQRRELVIKPRLLK